MVCGVCDTREEENTEINKKKLLHVQSLLASQLPNLHQSTINNHQSKFPHTAIIILHHKLVSAEPKSIQ